MNWQYVTPLFLVLILGILVFIWWKSIINQEENSVCIFFFVCNVQDYFEGLMWDLRRISKWRGRDIVIYVTDIGSSDDTVHIMKLLEQKGFLRQLTPRQSARFLRAKTNKGLSNWIFNLKEDTDVKETRKCFVRIFTDHIQPTSEQTQLF